MSRGNGAPAMPCGERTKKRMQLLLFFELFPADHVL
nr:MAG TPA: hypothetical protein [Inoviridae sp.]